MAVAHETVVFDVYDFKVYPMLTDSGASATYGAAVDVPGIAQVGLDPNLLTAELKGDGGQVLAKKGRIDRFNLSATYGKVALDVLAVIVGGTVTDPDANTAQWSLTGTNSLPYFKAAFLINDVEVGLGGVRCILPKAQLTGGTLITGSTDEFGQPTMELEGIPTNAGAKKMIDVFLDQTLVALT